MNKAPLLSNVRVGMQGPRFLRVLVLFSHREGNVTKETICTCDVGRIVKSTCGVFAGRTFCCCSFVCWCIVAWMFSSFAVTNHLASYISESRVGACLRRILSIFVLLRHKSPLLLLCAGSSGLGNFKFAPIDLMVYLFAQV